VNGTREEKKMSGAIVCGIDGSADSKAALAVAERYASRLNAKLVLAHVVESVAAPYAAIGPMGAGGFRAGPLLPELEEEQVKAGERLVERMAFDAGLNDAERRVVFGHPAERLADLADDEEAELIVVGSRGRGAFKAAFLGSVSSSLVGVARCPVLIVPPGASEA
jgi:nucleotide-binding universal stress UspA family protein